MKSLRAIVCLVAALLLVGLLAFQAVAERPQTREIKSKVMWGDPDEPAGCRRVDKWQKSLVGMPDYETTMTGLVLWSEDLEEEQTPRVSIAPMGLEVRKCLYAACRPRAIRR